LLLIRFQISTGKGHIDLLLHGVRRRETVLTQI
jgi:hypothetical protein